MTQPITQERIAELRRHFHDAHRMWDAIRPSVAIGILDALAASLAEAQRLLTIVQGQEIECRHREQQDEVYRFQLAARDREIQRLRDELARRDAVPTVQHVTFEEGVGMRVSPDGQITICRQDAGVEISAEDTGRRDAVRVEVPELTWQDVVDAEDPNDRRDRFAIGYAFARSRARLVPAPPQADAVVVDAEQLAKAYCIALNVPPEELRARMLNDDPVDGHFPNGIPGMFAWRYSLKMAEGIVENLRALAAGGEG